MCSCTSWRSGSTRISLRHPPSQPLDLYARVRAHSLAADDLVTYLVANGLPPVSTADLSLVVVPVCAHIYSSRRTRRAARKRRKAPSTDSSQRLTTRENFIPPTTSQDIETIHDNSCKPQPWRKGRLTLLWATSGDRATLAWMITKHRKLLPI